MRDTFVRLGSALRISQSEVGTRYVSIIPGVRSRRKWGSMRDVYWWRASHGRGSTEEAGTRFVPNEIRSVQRTQGRTRKAQKSHCPCYLLTNLPTKEGSSWRKGISNTEQWKLLSVIRDFGNRRKWTFCMSTEESPFCTPNKMNLSKEYIIHKKNILTL